MHTFYPGLLSRSRDWTGLIMLLYLFLVHFFLFVPCGGLSWLHVSFLLHIVSYALFSCRFMVRVLWYTRFSADFWYVCHWHKIPQSSAGHAKQRSAVASY